MTHRRLFLYLLVFGTLMLSGVWWYSMRTSSVVTVVLPENKVFTGGTIAAIQCGTLATLWVPGVDSDSSSFHFDFESRAVSGLPRSERYGVMGKFEIDAAPEEAMDCVLVLIPLWLIYLLFAAAGFVLMRWGERRSAASVEKALALRNAGEDVVLETSSGKDSPAP